MIRAFVIALGVFVADTSEPGFVRAGSRRGVAGRHARQDRSPETEAAGAALEDLLGQAERIECVAAAVGCTLLLTSRHLVVVREGVKHRPKSGIRLWPLERGLTMRLTETRTAARLAIAHAEGGASVFLSADQVADARRLIAAARRRAYRAR